MEIVLIPIGELLPYARNARTHSVSQIKQIAASIKEFGFRDPVEVAADKTIIAGHGRVEAAQVLGLKQIPCIVHDDLTKEQWRAYNLVNNKLTDLSSFDMEMLTAELGELKIDFDFGDMGFDLADLEDKKEGNEGLTDPDEVPETPQNIHNVQRGDIYQLGDHRLMCGDSTDKADVEKLMNGEKADMVFTDPPYGTNDQDLNGAYGSSKLAKANKYKRVINDNITMDLSFIFLLADKAFLWGANYFAHLFPAGRWFVWDKQRPENTDQSDCELAWSNISGSKVQKFTFLWNGFITGEKTERMHPNQKPVGLFVEIFDKIFKSEEVVLDLFLGSGSTLIACEKTGRKCYGMEIDPHYCSVIIERWQKFTGKEAVKLEGLASEK